MPPNEGNDAGSASHRQPLIIRLAMVWLSYLGQGQVSDRSSSHPVTILCSTIKACRASQAVLVVKTKQNKQTKKPQLLRLCRCGFNPRVRKISWRRARQPTPVFLPGESHGQRSLVGYSESRTQLKQHGMQAYVLPRQSFKCK